MAAIHDESRDEKIGDDVERKGSALEQVEHSAGYNGAANLDHTDDLLDPNSAAYKHLHSGHHDKARQFLATHLDQAPISPEEERKLVLKIDLILLPIVGFLIIDVWYLRTHPLRLP